MFVFQYFNCFLFFFLCTIVTSGAKDPFNFDADPDPGSALGKNGFIIVYSDIGLLIK